MRAGRYDLWQRPLPDLRIETIDVHTRLAGEARDALRRHRRALYWSPHTTAGYVEETFRRALQAALSNGARSGRLNWMEPAVPPFMTPRFSAPIPFALTPA